ncbi:hypothetical protein C8D97_101185 [Pleionea mediterranea]|uniref:Uncharacterized protein n=1 Tax=Pleionea mediterranea TaxID=523701 RepID=A0A316GHT6_9GAMM|nr:hypothetical protein C8D97_101185 [Pleionea mediterranea]
MGSKRSWGQNDLLLLLKSYYIGMFLKVKAPSYIEHMVSVHKNMTQKKLILKE